jgi:hypothetical protein
VNRVIQEPKYCLLALQIGSRIWQHTWKQSGQVDFDRREGLTQLIVNFPCNPGAFLFPRGLQSRGQRSQLVERTVLLRFSLFAAEHLLFQLSVGSSQSGGAG